jgi:exonuclease III
MSLHSLRIIFWNVYKKDLTDLVCSMTQVTNADVLVLNESPVSIQKMLESLQMRVSRDFYYPYCIAESEQRFHCFCKDRHLDLSEVHAGSRISVRMLRIEMYKILLTLVHGKDSRNYDPASQQAFAQSLATELRFLKQDKGISKLILLGDFNMNPYDRSMNLAEGLNAMMTKSCVEQRYRRYD